MFRITTSFLKLYSLFLLFRNRLLLGFLLAFSPESFEWLHRKSLVEGHLKHFLDLLLSGSEVKLVNLLELLHLIRYHFSLNLIPDPFLASLLRFCGADSLTDKVIKGGCEFGDLLLHG